MMRRVSRFRLKEREDWKPFSTRMSRKVGLEKTKLPSETEIVADEMWKAKRWEKIRSDVCTAALHTVFLHGEVQQCGGTDAHWEWRWTDELDGTVCEASTTEGIVWDTTTRLWARKEEWVTKRKKAGRKNRNILRRPLLSSVQLSSEHLKKHAKTVGKNRVEGASAGGMERDRTRCQIDAGTQGQQDAGELVTRTSLGKKQTHDAQSLEETAGMVWKTEWSTQAAQQEKLTNTCTGNTTRRQTFGQPKSAMDDGGECGVVISATDRLEWFTVCEVALPQVKSSAIQAELRGCDVWLWLWWWGGGDLERRGVCVSVELASVWCVGGCGRGEGRRSCVVWRFGLCGAVLCCSRHSSSNLPCHMRSVFPTVQSYLSMFWLDRCINEYFFMFLCGELILPTCRFGNWKSCLFRDQRISIKIITCSLKKSHLHHRSVCTCREERKELPSESDARAAHFVMQRLLHEEIICKLQALAQFTRQRLTKKEQRTVQRLKGEAMDRT